MKKEASILTRAEPLRHQEAQILFWKQTKGLEVSKGIQSSFSMFERNRKMKKALHYIKSRKMVAVSEVPFDYFSEISLFSALFSILRFVSVRRVAHFVNIFVGGITE